MSPAEPATEPDGPGVATSMPLLVATDGSDHAVKAVEHGGPGSSPTKRVRNRAYMRDAHLTSDELG